MYKINNYAVVILESTFSKDHKKVDQNRNWLVTFVPAIYPVPL